MYDRPETAASLDRLWALIRDALRARGVAAPERLHRGPDLWALWTAGDIVLAQTCGLPYRARLHRHVALIGTPDHGVAGCPPGYYRSVLVVRAEDARSTLAAHAGARLAYNEALSQSGWAAPVAHADAQGVRLRPVGPTGSHAASVRAVVEGRADIAGIDAVSWALMRRHDAALTDRLRVLATTAPTPGLPLIAAAGADRTAILAACRDAVARLPGKDRDTLSLRGITDVHAGAYLALPLPPAP